MGILYAGPYAHDLNADTDHEGYAARLMPDGTLSSGWSTDPDWPPHVGLVGACSCGWRAERVHSPGDLDGPEYQAAESDFEAEHLGPLVDAAAARSWPDWAARTISWANETAIHIAAGRPHDARYVLDLLRDDLNHRINIADELAEERDWLGTVTDQTANLLGRHDSYGRPFRHVTNPTQVAAPAPPPPRDPPPRGRGR